MDLDLGQVRAFVAAADTHNFGRAAEQLQLTQQALSKRIAQLETGVGTLFERHPRGVALTARGVRFLPAARDLLAAADAAAATARTPTTAPLRVDVWGHLHPPYALVQAFAVARPDLVGETSMRRNLPLALRALQRREIDAALGNVAGLGRPLPPSLTSEPVTTTPLAALLNTRHPLAVRSQLLPDDLRRYQLWWPTEPGSPELDRFAADYARAVGVRLSTHGRNTGLEGLLEDVRRDASRITIVSTQWPLPHDHLLTLVPIRPTPHFPWYLVWPAATRHPALTALREDLHERGDLPEGGHGDVWLPAIATW